MSAQDDDQNLLDQYMEKQTSRLTVTDNYIWTIIAVAWLVVPTLWITLYLYAKRGNPALLAPHSIGSFARLTIEHCPEPVLWAPILVALSINVLAHAGLWYQCRNLESLKTTWLNCQGSNVPHLRTLLLYRLKKKRSIGGSKRVFFTEEGLHDLIERSTRGAATIEKITQGQKLGRRGLRNRTSRASRIIKAVRDSNNAMVSFERIVFKAKQLNDKGVLTDSRGENLATAATNYMANALQSELERKQRMEKSHKARGNYVFLTFPSSYEACITFKALRSQGMLSLGTLNDADAKSLYDSRKHVLFAPPKEDILWDDIGATRGESWLKDLRFYLIYVPLILVAAGPLSMMIGAVYNFREIGQYSETLKAWIERNDAVVSNVSTILPPILMAATNALALPLLIEVIVRLKSSVTHSQRNRSLIKLLFAFQVIIQFFVFVLLGPIVQLLYLWINTYVQWNASRATLNTTWGIISRAPQAISSTSNYWLSWLTIQCMTAFLGFLRGAEEWILKYIAIWQGKNTPRDCEKRQAIPFDSPFRYQTFLLQITITLIMIPIAPLCGLISVMLLLLVNAVHQYQIVYVGRDYWEGRGEVWVSLCDSFQVGICLMHLILASIVATRSDSVVKFLVTFMGAPIVGGFRILVLRALYVKMELATPSSETDDEKQRIVKDNYVFQHPALDDSKNPFYTCCYSQRDLQEIGPFYNHLDRTILTRATESGRLTVGKPPAA
ncbi:hypothetical protein NliqN6_5471 [Naganishia liquefaciens]|uniref:CSC1/OSCA1-like 7TM region domain-containing protein n=1 Tax=Naganishia liquefaciens TaxID=104408 RepID=A0A8H3TXS9_9TREE|nr:hypothetical protein NliqN6_5471 [Naganishia liquefaciens]